MEGLRAQAREEVLRDGWMEKRASDKAFQLTTIRKYAAGVPTIHEENEFVKSDEIMYRTTQSTSPHQNRTVVASLQMLHMSHDDGWQPYFSRETFLKLFEAFRLDIYSLNLFDNQVFGFYQLPCDLAPPNGSSSRNFYLKTASAHLFWSHDSADASTKLILLSLDDTTLRSVDRRHNRLARILGWHKDLITEPWFPLFASGSNQVEWCYDQLKDQNLFITKIERETGHGWGSAESRDRPTTQRLAIASKDAGIIQTDIVDIMRVIYFTKRDFKDLAAAVASDPKGVNSAIEAVAILGKQIDSMEKNFSLVQERARIQQSVIFNLLAREDANASREIAEAAKQDSSAMKTIAIMTMAFLPGTFFAALFAVPLLQWQAEKVMNHRFWIYWAFTLPCTGLIFLIWWGLAFRREKASDVDCGGKRKEDDEEGFQEWRNSSSRRDFELGTLKRRRRRRAEWA